jgi:perosamine synthetase
MKRVGALEKKLVREVLSSEFRSSKSVNMLARAEEAFADLTGSSFAIGCVNGTATLHLALEALGVGAGDEVIVPSLTMSATCFSVLHANATPVFADVDPDTWQIDPESVRQLITDKTKAIMTVALYGGSPDYDRLKAVAGDIPLVEDNAEALGTTYRGKPIGSFGAFASYSFQSSKHLSSGEGGMLTANNRELADQARVFQTLGYAAVRNRETRKIPKAVIQNPDYMRHESLGWNYRMPEVIAAIVLAQTQRADQLVKVRRDTAARLLEIVDSVSWLVPQANYVESESSFWALGLSLERSDISWAAFYEEFLSNGGRGFYAAWALGYQEPAFSQLKLQHRDRFLTRDAAELFRSGQNPQAESLQRKIMALRTNEWSVRGRVSQANALIRTIRAFGG